MHDIDLNAPPLRWGIAAPGGIAADFVSALLAHTRQRIVAVGSRSPERAARFAERFGIGDHGDYSVLHSPSVDVVYVASVNSAHEELALSAIEAGKHVLIEKPFATSATQARRIADAARSTGVMAMEAMWTRYVPTYLELDQRIRDGALGDVSYASASVGWYVAPDADTRINDPLTGGGVTLDMGVYALWFAQFAIGRTQRVAATGRMRGDVDEQFVAALDTSNGRQAAVSSTISATTSGHAEIAGSKGRAVVAGHLVFPTGFDVETDTGSQTWRDESPLKARDGLAWQAAALAGYVSQGLLDSPLHSMDDTIALAETMDAVRAQIGLSHKADRSRTAPFS